MLIGRLHFDDDHFPCTDRVLSTPPEPDMLASIVRILNKMGMKDFSNTRTGFLSQKARDNLM